MKILQSCRETSLGILNKQSSLRALLKVTEREARLAESQILLGSCSVARSQDALQDALTSATYLTRLAEHSDRVGVHVHAASDFETAEILWLFGEKVTSVRLLRDLNQRLINGTLACEDLGVGRPGLLAKLVSKFESYLTANSLTKL